MANSTKSAFSTLRAIPELLSVPDFQLEWLLQNSEFQSLQKDQYLFEPETPVDRIYIVLEGTIELFLFQSESKRFIVRYQKGGILGYLPFSRVQKSYAFGIATTSVELLSYPKSEIQELIKHNPELTEELVHIMISRDQNFTSQALHNEKMQELGKLSAGLTHELNNPITSINRDNADLNRLFLSENLSELVCSCSGLDKGEQPNLLKAINNWKHSSRVAGLKPTEIRNLENDWMEKLTAWGMKNPEEAAEVFTDSGIDSEEILYWVKKLNPNMVDTWLSWIQFLLQTQALVSNIKNATERISRLIGAIKSYTHIDRAPVKSDVDLSKGIEDTLSILAHKIKAYHVEVIFTKPESPITIFGFPGELNQIWTNLIDNAIDAMEATPSPKLEIRIIPKQNTISIEITDNGPGIPDEIKPKIFDPFFTTKGIGKGTGMGLELVNQIVNKHEGSIQVESLSGQTTFKVELPKD